MGQKSSTPTEEESRIMAICSSSLYKALSHKSVQPRCAITRHKWISTETLDEHITGESVRACTTLGNLMCGKYVAEGIAKQAKKAFAVLTLINCDGGKIEELLHRDGLTDGDLPLEKHSNGESLVSAKTGKEFSGFRELSPPYVDNFLERQWLVLPPVFDEADTDPEVYPIRTLGEDCPLPLKKKELLTSTDTSRVSKCELHPEYYRSSVQQKRTDHIPVAVKEIFGNNSDEMFKTEVKILAEIRQFNNPHLIRHIAACEAESDPPLRCIIFPSASGGDLRDYWVKRDSEPRTPELVWWSLKQMHGLATGIRDLHSSFKNMKGSNVRHGDLKPQNILIFEDEGEEKRLVVADVGIAKVHMGPTAVRTQKATGTLATTRAYEAPEAHKAAGQTDFPRSRAYDIWSLGCIFLEFTIWLLFDVCAVDSFADHRPKKWTGFQGPGGFYDISPNGTPGVCEEARRALADLLDDDRCGEDAALGRLVRLISKKMLVADVRGRCLAEELVERLKGIWDGVSDKGDEYFLKLLERPVSVPEMFRPVRRGSRSGSITK